MCISKNIAPLLWVKNQSRHFRGVTILLRAAHEVRIGVFNTAREKRHDGVYSLISSIRVTQMNFTSSESACDVIVHNIILPSFVLHATAAATTHCACVGDNKTLRDDYLRLLFSNSRTTWRSPIATYAKTERRRFLILHEQHLSSVTVIIKKEWWV